MTKYITIGIILIAIVLLIVYRNKLTGLFPSSAPPATPAATGTTTTTTPPVLNMDLDLHTGSTGPEVRQLQTWLGGITVDGQFGPKTKAALLTAKCVDHTTLNQYATTTCPDWQNANTNASASGNDAGSGWSWMNYFTTL